MAAPLALLRSYIDRFYLAAGASHIILFYVYIRFFLTLSILRVHHSCVSLRVRRGHLVGKVTLVSHTPGIVQHPRVHRWCSVCF